MSTSVRYDELCPRCGHPHLYFQHETRTGETMESCSYCGFFRSFEYKRNKKGDFKHKKIHYPRDKVYFGIKNYLTNEFMFLMPVDNANLYDGIVADFINEKEMLGQEPYSSTYNNLFYVEGFGTNEMEAKQLYYIGNKITIPKSGDVIVHEAILETTETNPGGVVIVPLVTLDTKRYYLDEGISKRDAINKVSKILEKHKNSMNPFGTKADWYNPETKEMEDILP